MVHPTFLPDSDKAKGYALLCQAKPLSDVVVEVEGLEGLAGIEPRSVPCRVGKLTRAAPDVMVLQFRLPPNDNMRFLAGQYVNFVLPDGDSRSYSIASAPDSAGVAAIELHLRHSPGGKFTDRVFSSMRERELLRFEGPMGTFYLREKSDKPIILVASGTGFAPIKSMCQSMIAKGVPDRRPVVLYWGCRTKQDLYMLDVPARWADEVEGFTFHPILSDPTVDCAWQGRTGLVHDAVCADYPDMSGVQVYASGNPAMIDAARRDFIRQGLPEKEFFADAFLTAAEKSVGGRTG